MNQSHFNLEDATSNLKKALELDPDLGELYENLGYIYLVTLDLPQAEKYLLRGYQLSPSWEKACSLADSFRYSGDLTNAINFREWALHNLETAKPNDYVVGSESTWNRMPLTQGDRKTISRTVSVNTLDEKKAFVHYGLSIDYALDSQIPRANAQRDAALKIDDTHEYTRYFAEISDSLRLLGNTDAPSRAWLLANAATLNRLPSPDQP